MTITIDNDAELFGMWEEYNVEKRTIPYLCRTLAHMFSGHPELVIELHREVLADTYAYILNPTQLAKNCNADSAWEHTEGRLRGKYVCLVFRHETPPPKFFEQACDAARNGDTVKFTQQEVPLTYWANPTLLRYRIKQVTSRKIRTQKGKDWLKVICPKF